MALITFTKEGIYCAQADVYIDPWKSVKNAFITHGHSDHARRGHQNYLCVHESVPILNHRLKGIKVSGVNYGEEVKVNGVSFSFHPAGHVIGSAQIRVSHKGETWVISGDYKVVDDGISGTYEAVECDHFITECTFGLPVYEWEDQRETFSKINAWWRSNKEEGKTSLITAYSLGKAQRLIHNIDHSIGKIYTHGAVEELNNVLREHNLLKKETTYISPDLTSETFIGNLIIAPGSAIGTAWAKKFKNLEIASATGWNAIRGMKRRRGLDQAFVLSDHCDWPGLLTAVKATGATHIYPTHGYTDIVAQYLRGEGYYSQPVSTEFSAEKDDDVIVE